MIVRLHFHQSVGQCGIAAVHTAGIGVKALYFSALHHCGIVVIRHHIAFGMQLVRIANHFEQAHRLGLAIDDEVGIENFVTAVLRVRLREHHQLDIGRIALCFLVRIHQIIHFIVRQRQAQLDIRLSQC